MKPAEPVASSPWEIAGIIVLCFGLPIAGSIAALAPSAHEATFSTEALLNTVLFELIFGGLALFILKRRGYALKELLPLPQWKSGLIGLLLYASFFIIQPLILHPFATQQGEQAIERIMAGSKPSLLAVLLLAVVNSLYEEVFVLSYMVRALGKYGGSFAIGASTLLRLMYHLYQGPLGALSVVVFSVVVGAYYWRTRDLWSVVCAHMVADILPFLM